MYRPSLSQISTKIIFRVPNTRNWCFDGIEEIRFFWKTFSSEIIFKVFRIAPIFIFRLFVEFCTIPKNSSVLEECRIFMRKLCARISKSLTRVLVDRARACVERRTGAGDNFQFCRTVRRTLPSGNFETNWLSESRLCKQMSVDFVARAVESRSTVRRGPEKRRKRGRDQRIPKFHLIRRKGSPCSFRTRLHQEPVPLLSINWVRTCSCNEVAQANGRKKDEKREN